VVAKAPRVLEGQLDRAGDEAADCQPVGAELAMMQGPVVR
jgi:hypothetical protein